MKKIKGEIMKIGKDVISSTERMANHETAKKRLYKQGYRINNTVTTLCGSRTAISGLQKKAASYGKSLSAFLIEAGSHYTPNRDNK